MSDNNIFFYLEINILDSRTLNPTIKYRNTQGKKAIVALNGILCDQKITQRNKHLIYNTIINSIATYSREVQQLKERVIKRWIVGGEQQRNHEWKNRIALVFIVRR